MTAAFVPPGMQTFVDENGSPLVGGKVHHYIPGGSTRKDTWQDYDQGALNTNPIILDARGQAAIWGTGNYRQVLTDSDDNEIWDVNVTIGAQNNILASGALSGLTIANNQGNPTTQIDVALGQCRDSTNTADIILEGGLTKLITAVWAAGTGVGMRDSATALAAGDSFHIFAIYNPTTLAVDVLASKSATAPNLPNGYTYFRRVGSLPRLGADNRPPSGTNIPAFLQWGGKFTLYRPNAEYTNQTGSTVPQLIDLLVPLGIKVEVMMYSQYNIAAGATALLNFSDPDLGVPIAFGGTDQWANIRLSTAESYLTAIVNQTTNTSGQLYAQQSAAGGIWATKSVGWWDNRGMG